MSDTRSLNCHCAAVELSVEFDDGLQNIRHCDCSLCCRKGYVMASVPVSHLQVVKGEESLSCYQWNTRVAKHYFCKICGVYTHHQRRSNPSEYGINIACLEGVNPYSYGEVPIGNGDLNAPLPPLNGQGDV